MDYTIEKGKITVLGSEFFDPQATLECGQLFRYKKTEDGYVVFALNHKAEVKKEGNNVIIYTNSEYFFEKYFDLRRNYGIIVSELSDKSQIPAQAEYGKGIRILNQDPLETLFSFIISANNNIPRIKGILERIVEGLGEKADGFYAFPTAEKLASAGENFYRSVGAGYRAAYLDKTAKAIAGGFDLEKVYDMSTDEARKYLYRLTGVGPKVCDCILLFAYHKTDTFPVDTWIKKVFVDLFGYETTPKEMSEKLLEKFGNLSGYAQQYLFYYKRGQ